MKAIIGYTGFVGSNIIDGMDFDFMFNSKNIHEIGQHDYELIVCAGIPSLKWYANKYPQKDLDNINDLITNLRNVNCEKFVLISSSDVYEKTFDNPELIKCSDSHHAYGRNRYHAEKEIKKIFRDVTILRLPSVFGKNLKKNLIYDLMHKNLYEKLNLCTTLQWYDAGDMAKDIKYTLDNNISELDLFTEPITMKEIVDEFFDVDPNETYFDCNNAIRYDLKCNIMSNGYWETKEQIMKKLRKFIENNS